MVRRFEEQRVAGTACQMCPLPAISGHPGLPPDTEYSGKSCLTNGYYELSGVVLLPKAIPLSGDFSPVLVEPPGVRTDPIATALSWRLTIYTLNQDIVLWHGECLQWTRCWR